MRSLKESLTEVLRAVIVIFIASTPFHVSQSNKNPFASVHLYYSISSPRIQAFLQRFPYKFTVHL